VHGAWCSPGGGGERGAVRRPPQYRAPLPLAAFAPLASLGPKILPSPSPSTVLPFSL
jgi:hypothetical protein